MKVKPEFSYTFLIELNDLEALLQPKRFYDSMLNIFLFAFCVQNGASRSS